MPRAVYTNARAILTYTDGTGTFKEGDNMDGFRLGAGAQYEIGRVGARLEYRYSDYGNFTYRGVDTGISARRQQVVVTLLTKF